MDHPFRTVSPDQKEFMYYDSVSEALDMVAILYHDEYPKPEIQQRVAGDQWKNILWFIYRKLPGTEQWENIHGPFLSRAAADSVLSGQSGGADQLEVRP